MIFLDRDPQCKKYTDVERINIKSSNLMYSIFNVYDKIEFKF